VCVLKGRFGTVGDVRRLKLSPSESRLTRLRRALPERVQIDAFAARDPPAERRVLERTRERLHGTPAVPEHARERALSVLPGALQVVRAHGAEGFGGDLPRGHADAEARGLIRRAGDTEPSRNRDARVSRMNAAAPGGNAGSPSAQTTDSVCLSVRVGVWGGMERGVRITESRSPR